MIIVDYSQVVIAGYMILAGAQEVELDMVRHVALDSIRKLNSKFRNEYGEMVIAVDSKKGSWRKEVFPYYKANRAEVRQKSTIDWKHMSQCIAIIKEEIQNNFPYKVIEVDYAEADDIIGVLTREAVSRGEKVLIASGDKDFIQLQIGNSLVCQWANAQEKYVSHEDPKRYLFEHVLKGDRGDGIPNILSAPDILVTKEGRQPPMTKKRLDGYWDDMGTLKDNPRFTTNLKIIDLNFTPKEIKTQIKTIYEEYPPLNKSGVQEYFIKHRMKRLYEKIGDF